MYNFDPLDLEVGGLIARQRSFGLLRAWVTLSGKRFNSQGARIIIATLILANHRVSHGRPKLKPSSSTRNILPRGGGEQVIIRMGAFVAKAAFDATGVRLLQLPMTQERIKAALATA
jgi:hypothetical protein